MTKDEWIESYLESEGMANKQVDGIPVDEILSDAWDAGFREAMTYHSETYDPIKYPSIKNPK